MAVVMVRVFRDGVIGSKFAHEGCFIAELRSSLCLAGWPWPVADEAARKAVAEALRLARASRSTWADGQRVFVGLEVKEFVCRQCGVGLRERQVHWCSNRCAKAWNAAFDAKAA
jgi:hypothetical protein